MEQNIPEVFKKTIEEKEDLSYVNPNGDEVYGFTQSKKNADEIILQQKRNNALITWLIMVGALFFIMAIYILYRVESGNILANIVASCVN
ncbi:hypothetical protein LCGC14_1596540 [marine sediment metagenome]|uniref:Uncharacterized protein n=1 Tax=marine sediment metagenome TaxID=412755 RepID=A0A0F9ICT8_9ZZZZ